MKSRLNRHQKIGVTILLVIAIVFFAVFVFQFRDMVREDALTLLYYFVTFSAALSFLVLLRKCFISGKVVIASIPLNMFFVFVVLLLVCRWEGSTEGWVLVAPDWLGGFQQGGPSFRFGRPSKLHELLVNAFSPDLFLGNSLYANTLFYWPGLIIWVASVFVLHLLSIGSKTMRQ